MTDAPPDPKLDIDWLRTLAGALAAVTTAVLLSTLGAAGTLIGAALGSVAATVGTALYAQGLARSRAKVAKVQETALHKVGVAQAEVRRAARRQGDEAAVEAHLEHADEQLAQAQQDLDDTGPETAAGESRLGLPWKRIALLAAATFVVAVLALSAFELIGGKPVSSYTGGSDGSGTSISRLTGSGDGGGDSDDDGSKKKEDQSDQPTQAPSDGASIEPDESAEPSQEPGTPSASPDDALTETPSGTPSTTPSGTPGTTTAPSPTAPGTPTTSPTR